VYRRVDDPTDKRAGFAPGSAKIDASGSLRRIAAHSHRCTRRSQKNDGIIISRKQQK
jgi:hypothetical protein